MSIPRFIEIIRNQGQHHSESSSTLTGEITSVNPLNVKTNDIVLDADQLKMINTQTFQVGEEVLILIIQKYYVILGRLEGVT